MVTACTVSSLQSRSRSGPCQRGVSRRNAPSWGSRQAGAHWHPATAHPPSAFQGSRLLACASRESTKPTRFTTALTAAGTTGTYSANVGTTARSRGTATRSAGDSPSARAPRASPSAHPGKGRLPGRDTHPVRRKSLDRTSPVSAPVSAFSPSWNRRSCRRRSWQLNTSHEERDADDNSYGAAELAPQVRRR